MAYALRTFVQIHYAGVNITDDIAPDLLNFQYTDNESGEADDISLTLKNDHGRWSGDWFPTLGDKMQAVIFQEGEGALGPLECGTFTLDEFTQNFNGGSTVEFKGVSVPSEKSVRKQEKSKAWEEVKLSEIASDVAKTAGLALNYATKIDPLYDRKDQAKKPDLKFLKELCEEEALNLKITDQKLVIFDPVEMDAQPPNGFIVIGEHRVKSASFTIQNHDVAESAKVEYKDPKTGKTTAAEAKSDTVKDGKTEKLTVRASSQEEAERKAKAALYKKNSKEITGNITLVGDTSLRAGMTTDVVNLGRNDGRYKINKATHTISASEGYITAIEVSHTKNPAKPEAKAAAEKVKK